MSTRVKTLAGVLVTVTFGMTVSALGGDEFLRPLTVTAASGNAFPSPDDAYVAAAAIDGDPQTFCCLLDDTADGCDPQTMPPNAAPPVTGWMVFDLGRRVPVRGARLTSRANPGAYNPRDVDFVAWTESKTVPQDLGNAEAKGQTVALITGHSYPPLRQGESSLVGWKEMETRFVGLRVHSSYESGGKHFNFQIAEIDFLVPPGSVPPEPVDFTAEMRSLDCLQQAVQHLAQQFPGVYRAEAFLARKHVLQERLDQASVASDQFDLAAWRADLHTLQYDALVRDNPLLAAGKLLFVKRHTYQTGWYYAEFMQGGRFGGNLCVLSLDDGSVRPLLPDLADGLFDRFDLSFDGKRIAFGYRPAPGRAFRLYETDREGASLRQLTFDPPDEAARLASYGLTPGRNELGPWRGHTDDFHPCYLPDGGICFASSRCERGVLCDQPDNLSVNVLYRIDADGGDLRCLSQGALSESTPSVMNDGRILYTRWEYVDKGVIAVQSLWSMRPDGSGAAEVFGNHHEFPPVLIHARALPGSNDRFVATSTMHHPFAVGPILKIDVRRDIRTLEPLRSLTPDTGLSIDGPGGFPRGESFTHRKNGKWVRDNRGPLYCDPYPLSDEFFLVTCNPDSAWNDSKAYGLWMIDTFGNQVRIYADPNISCWQPVPLQPRPRAPALQPGTERILPSESAAANGQRQATATLLMQDVYAGLDGVPPGEVKYLRIFEQVPRPWTARRFWPDDAALGQNAVISLNAHIYVKLLHGIVPVEADGAAHFTVPAERNLFFQALDERFQEIQRMRTFVNLQPGEVRSCIGCHESRNRTPLPSAPLAWHGDPITPSAQPGEMAPRALDYATDVQPIWDQHCVRCHGRTDPDGDLDLTGDLTTYFNRSYETIMRRNLIACIQEFQGPDPEAQKTNVTPLPPRALGSQASRLVQVLREGHYDVCLPLVQWVRLVTWGDANGPYYGSYFGRRNLVYRDLTDFRPTTELDPAGRIIPVLP